MQKVESPPESGSFFYVSHDRMSPTMALRLGDDIFFFGESVLQDGRSVDDLPDSTVYWGPLPSPPFKESL